MLAFGQIGKRVRGPGPAGRDHGPGRSGSGSADASVTATPTAVNGFGAGVVGDMCDVHTPPIMSLLTCEKGLPPPHALDMHIGGNVYPLKISKYRRNSGGIMSGKQVKNKPPGRLETASIQ